MYYYLLLLLFSYSCPSIFPIALPWPFSALVIPSWLLLWCPRSLASAPWPSAPWLSSWLSPFGQSGAAHRPDGFCKVLHRIHIEYMHFLLPGLLLALPRGSFSTWSTPPSCWWAASWSRGWRFGNCLPHLNLCSQMTARSQKFQMQKKWQQNLLKGQFAGQAMVHRAGSHPRHWRWKRLSNIFPKGVSSCLAQG